MAIFMALLVGSDLYLFPDTYPILSLPHSPTYSMEVQVFFGQTFGQLVSRFVAIWLSKNATVGRDFSGGQIETMPKSFAYAAKPRSQTLKTISLQAQG